MRTPTARSRATRPERWRAQNLLTWPVPSSLPYTVTLSAGTECRLRGPLGSCRDSVEYRDYNYNHNVFDNLSWTLGKHSLKFGLSYNHYLKSENAAGDNVGNYNFDATNAHRLR